MPWKKTSLVEERLVFAALARDGRFSMARLSAQFGISPKTGFKWRARNEKFGIEGLQDLSRAPKTCPHATAPALVKRIVALRRKYGYGPRKLVAMLAERFPEKSWPAASTVGDILKREQLIRPRVRVRRAPRLLSHLTPPSGPNSVWCIDFKGEFKTRDGIYCWPLTITDASTRFLLGCFAFPSPTIELTMAALEDVFDAYGLPEIMRSDNGTPFASRAIAGLTKVSLQWLRYGISPERTRPATPSDNGRHERFHRTLKEATAMPPKKNLRQQQTAFDRFRHDYNFIRPHEALGQTPPGRSYQPSERRKPKSLEAPSYPKHFDTLRVSTTGSIVLDERRFHLGHAYAGEVIGLEELPGERWGLHYGSLALAELHWKTGAITHFGRSRIRTARKTFDARHSRATVTDVPGLTDTDVPG